MVRGKFLTVDHAQEESILKVAPRPILFASHEAGWKNIHLAAYHLPAGETPEMVSLQHIISLSSWKHTTEVNLTFGGKHYPTVHRQNTSGCVEILPAHVAMKSNWDQEVEGMHCYLDPTFLAHAAYESVNPDRVEVKLALQQPDPLIWQICHALKTVLEIDANNSKFYADSMATALAAHFLQYYSIHQHTLPEHEDGLPKYKLKQAIAYINENLSEDISLSDVSNHIGMSQYYFCRLFKQSTGLSPRAYLIQQRVEKAKQLLKHGEMTINEIAIGCGFANPSHFAKHFREHTSLSPKQFRML